MPGSDYVRLFARDVGLAPQIGGADNVQDALAGIGGSSLTVVRHAFDHTQHAALAAGILIATLPQGAICLARTPYLSITTAFDGTTPVCAFATTQADAVANNGLGSTPTDPTAPDNQDQNTAWSVSGDTSVIYIAEGGTLPLWFALTDGASGDPASVNGAGEIVIVYIA